MSGLSFAADAPKAAGLKKISDQSVIDWGAAFGATTEIRTGPDVGPLTLVVQAGQSASCDALLFTPNANEGEPGTEARIARAAQGAHTIKPSVRLAEGQVLKIHPETSSGDCFYILLR